MSHINTYYLQGYVTTNKPNLSIGPKNNEPKVEPCKAVVKIRIDDPNFDGEDLVGTIYNQANAKICAQHKCEPQNINYGVLCLLDISPVDDNK